MFVFRLFRPSLKVASVAPLLSRRALFVASGLSVASIAWSSNVIANDASKNGTDGVDLDKAIDPFPTELTKANCPVAKQALQLVASGMRSVTFISFKVYAVGLYVPKKEEPKMAATVAQYLDAMAGMPVEELLNDKDASQAIMADMSSNINYTIRITPVRNTDFGHLRDGFVKTILACPLAKTMREEVGQGVEQLREAFNGFKGSVPKNDSLYLVKENDQITISYVNKNGKAKKLGTVTEPSIAKVLFVAYFSSAKPISESLRGDFVSYLKAKLA